MFARTEPELKLLVERELHSDVQDAEQARYKPAVERAYSFRAPDREARVECVAIAHLAPLLRLLTRSEIDTKKVGRADDSALAQHRLDDAP